MKSINNRNKKPLETLRVSSFVTQWDTPVLRRFRGGALPAPISDTKTGHDPISLKQSCTNLADCKVIE